MSDRDVGRAKPIDESDRDVGRAKPIDEKTMRDLKAKRK